MRYIRQEILPEIGKSGQLKIKKSTIAVVGVGALGTVSCELLARAGIGKLILIDRDFVELSNLQRQSLFDESDVGKSKAICAKEKLKKINSEINIESYCDDLDFNNAEKMLKNADLILDCTDNMETRFLLNDFCVKNKIPMVYSSGVGTKGYFFNVIASKTACLMCFLENSKSNDTCETAGVLNSLTHIVSSLQAKEAIKIILGKDFEKNLVLIDAWNNTLSKFEVKRKKGCRCCIKRQFDYLDGKIKSNAVKLCGQGIFQIKNSITKKQFIETKKRLEKSGKVIDFGNCINFENKITLFEDGRALIKAKDEKEAKSMYSKFVGS